MKDKNAMMEIFKMLRPNAQTKKQIVIKRGESMKSSVSISQINV